MKHIKALDCIENVEHLTLSNTAFWPVIRVVLFKRGSPNSDSVSGGRHLLWFLYSNALILLFSVFYRLLSQKSQFVAVASADRINAEGEDIYLNIDGLNMGKLDILMRPSLFPQKIGPFHKFLARNRVRGLLITPFVYGVLLNLAYRNRLCRAICFEASLAKEIDTIRAFCVQHGIPNLDGEIFKFLAVKKWFSQKLRGYQGVFFYCGYNVSNMALCASSREEKVESIEIQHGIYDPSGGTYHSFCGAAPRIACKVYAAKMLCFDNISYEYFSQKNSFLRHSQLSMMGFPILRKINQSSLSTKAKVTPKNVLIIPPFKPTTSELKKIELSRREFLKKDEVSISLRLHPTLWNNSSAQDVYKFLQIDFDFDDWECSILKYDTFIGYESNALLEAAALGKRVVLLDKETLLAKFLQPGLVDGH